MSIESEYRELMDALAAPTVGDLTREQELDELANLIAKYPREARQLLGQQERASR